LDLFEGGFIGEREYEIRKKQLEAVLNPEVKDKSGRAGGESSFWIIDGLLYDGNSKTSSINLNTASATNKQRISKQNGLSCKEVTHLLI